ncbi:RNA-directed DNA polymerase, eukaryota, reverse transcriptase zinc-binding domain protein [Tanacetum coccineum]|uniref:RNA-directed DNA polymerase, eukaryota, reverse transcriptase zinc-binding domain protein n=1 Tax=Tanacetum coccineum TaxID=301880 RepID=A0ABQ5F101_9ASTR
MTRLELFRIKSMWGNYAFDYACSMARGLSGGLISIWDPNMFSKNSIWCDDSFIIIKGNWKNVVGDCFMVNIYGPQDHVSKLALWNRLTDFMHHHNGSYIMFGDMNAVRNAQERFGTTLNSIEADHFNSFIDSTGNESSNLLFFSSVFMEGLHNSFDGSDVPFNYLGLPIGSNMKSIASWKTLVDRFHMRLSSWKANICRLGSSDI